MTLPIGPFSVSRERVEERRDLTTVIPKPRPQNLNTRPLILRASDCRSARFLALDQSLAATEGIKSNSTENGGDAAGKVGIAVKDEGAHLSEICGEAAQEVNRRSAEEAHLATAQRDGIRLFLDDERFEAVAVLTRALTGVTPARPPPSRAEDMLDLARDVFLPNDPAWVQPTLLPHTQGGYAYDELKGGIGVSLASILIARSGAQTLNPQR
jgi:hypothetical protein